LKDAIDSSPYLSGYTYSTFTSQAIADKNDTKYMKALSHGIDPEAVNPGDVLYVTGEQVENFFIHTAPKIRCPFSMVTAMWDAGVDQDLMSLMPEHLTRWFTINANVRHPKITAIPLGLGNKNWGWDNNIQCDPATYDKYRPYAKTHNVLASFSVRNKHGERLQCLNDAKNRLGNDLTVRDFNPADRKSDSFVDQYFEAAAHHKMVICPWGAGYDTHRLWETMYLGSIPITRACVAYREFADYPIIFLNHWRDLNLDYLLKEYDKQLEKLQTETRIYSKHWKEVIR